MNDNREEMNESREEILRVSGLKQYFKLGSGKSKMVNKAVDDISFSIYKGEVFSLVGESGCGKTTTGRSIIKLYQSTGGEVYFHGTRIFSDVAKEKEIYKEKKTKLDEQKKLEMDNLQEKLTAGRITKEDFTEKVSAINEKYNQELSEARDILKSAKRDRRFESIVDEKALKARNQIQSFPEYQEIVQKYKELNSNLKAEIAKGKMVENSAELKKLQKEIKLNEIRQKQDIAKLKYSMINKNRLLMRKMQMIFQDPIASLNPRMTVKEIIAEGLRINGVKNEKEIDDRVNEALKTVGLVPEHASRYPHEFSGGQRQRIGIARALVVEPTFIIADEPISALDVSIRAQIINLLNDLRETKGITIMFIAHDLSVVKYFSDRLAVMYYGHLVEIGDKNRIFDNPLHPYTLSLMASIPLPDPEYEKRRGRTVRYNPAKQHDYSKEAPSLREVEPDHFVLCNTEEFNRYQEQLKNK
ncbi:MAG: ATP-binding cassette domain-containing protein [Acholeplasmataceae bacterium]|nr:ATP-binding cassette domain-containing protein [Acholeplasmataceae bacterium]